MTVSYLKRKLYSEEEAFYLSRNYVVTASLQYLLVTTQETVTTEKNAKFATKGIRFLYMIIRLKTPNKKRKWLWAKGISLCSCEHEFGANKYVCGASNGKVKAFKLYS